MIVYKSSIRCKGDVHLKVDQYGNTSTAYSAVPQRKCLLLSM